MDLISGLRYAARKKKEEQKAKAGAKAGTDTSTDDDLAEPGDDAVEEGMKREHRHDRAPSLRPAPLKHPPPANRSSR
jgi:hypothetical protein